MAEILKSVQLTGLRLDSLGNYLAALGLMQACGEKWGDLRGLWWDGVFVAGAAELGREALCEFLLNEWRPTAYERWWKGSREVSRLRSWEPSLGRVKLLDAHIIAKGKSNVYNDILGTGGNVGKRDFSKVSEVCREMIRRPEAGAWLNHALFGRSQDSNGEAELPDLPSTGTWFAFANKAFNSGYGVAREGQLSPWSYLLALEGAILLRGGVGKRLGARAFKYATFPFVSEAAAPATAGEVERERSEFWAPIWDRPATLPDVKALLRRGQARVGNRAARAPFDFAAAVLSRGAQAGLSKFERFSLRETTSANTYEAIHSGTAVVGDRDALGKSVVEIANWVDSLPRDKAVYCGLQAPVERALLHLAESREADGWRDLLLAVGEVQVRVDRNRKWRESSRAISGLQAGLLDAAWPGEPAPELEIARSVAGLGRPFVRADEGQSQYSLRHNVFGLTRGMAGLPERFAEPRPAATVWHDGDAVRLLADILERRLVDAEGQVGNSRLAVPPLHGTRLCRASALNQFAMGMVDPSAVTGLLPSLSLLRWKRVEEPVEDFETLAPSSEFLLQGYFRPLVLAKPIRLAGGTDVVEPDAMRARALVKMIRGGMWQQAFDLAERVYRSCGMGVVRAPDVSASGDLIAACLLIPVAGVVTRETFRRRWVVSEKRKGKR